MRRALPTTIVALAACGLLSCSSDAAPTEAGYCTAVGDHLTELGVPQIHDQAGIDATIALYRSMVAAAPLAVSEEWEVMLTAIETASTVDPTDPASAQRAADTARQSTQAARRVVTYTQQKCGVTIGQVPVTTTSTTIDPAVSPASDVPGTSATTLEAGGTDTTDTTTG